MENNNGAEKLISSILEDAHEQASAIEWRANETVAAIKNKLEQDREALRDEFTQKAQAARELTLATARTNAELLSRKEQLAGKRALMEEAFVGAYKKLCAMTGEKREALIGRLLARECEGDEVVSPAAKDRAAIEKLLPACGVAGLTLGEDDPSITDGFTLKGKNYFKNCSFEALMDEVRELTSADVAKKLFD